MVEEERLSQLVSRERELEDQIRRLQENLRLSRKRIEALVAFIDAYEAEVREMRDGGLL